MLLSIFYSVLIFQNIIQDNTMPERFLTIGHLIDGEFEPNEVIIDNKKIIEFQELFKNITPSAEKLESRDHVDIVLHFDSEEDTFNVWTIRDDGFVEVVGFDGINTYRLSKEQLESFKNITE